MKPLIPLNIEELREKIVSELNIGHLKHDEQEQVLNKVSEMLLKKVTLDVMRLMPRDTLDELDRLAEAHDDAGVQALVRQYIPNIEDMVAQSARTGIEDYKREVARLVAAK